MQEYQTQGYGLFVNDIKEPNATRSFEWTADRLRTLISKIPELDIELRNSIEIENMTFDNASAEDIISEYLTESMELDKYKPDIEDEILPYAIIAMGANVIDNVNIELICDDEQGWTLMLCKTYPWQNSETERHLTIEQLNEIFKKWFRFIDIASENITPLLGEITCRTYE